MTSFVIWRALKEIVEHHTQYVFDTLWSRAIPAEQRIQEIEKSGEGRGQEGGTAVAEGDGEEEPAVSTETKIILEFQYQVFKKLEDSIGNNHINKKIRSILQPIMQKQSRDAKIQLESIKQLRYI